MVNFRGIKPGGPVAAVDLGSNSFHLIVARPADRTFHRLDRLREMVQLAAGLDKEHRLDAATQERALACLERFGERLQGMPSSRVRVVGTNTLRQARNAEGFLARAKEALGHPIEIIAGREEARLIYLGVSHSLPNRGERRLVADIGGGSTELIIGQGFSAQSMESLHMGCVSLSRQFFADGSLSRKAMGAAEMAARLELEPVAAAFAAGGWTETIGSSGTIRTIAALIAEKGWCEGGIDRASLDRLREMVLEAGNVARLPFKALAPERAFVLPGGIAILKALFNDLQIEFMRVSDWALREGLLFDLMGRLRHEDVRQTTVDALSRRYDIDAGQAGRVAETLRAIFDQIQDWVAGGEEVLQLAEWAARLHELGLAVAHSQYHRHGAYILENSDLSGFSSHEQKRMAALVRGHRRKFPLPVFEGLPDGALWQRLCLLLRLAVLLHRGRTASPPPSFSVKAEERCLQIRFARGWLDAHPLTKADLEHEAALLKAAGFRLKFA